MTKVILGITLSLDGFAEDIQGSVGPLYPDLESLDKTDMMKRSIRETGSVVMSKKIFGMTEDPDMMADHYEYQVPIFVFTDQPPEKHPKENGRISFTFVTDGIESAVKQAIAAAGDKNVNIIGSAETARLCLNAGVVDELQVDLIPILLNTGFRPFEDLERQSLQLERIKTEELPAGRVHIEFRIVR